MPNTHLLQGRSHATAVGCSNECKLKNGEAHLCWCIGMHTAGLAFMAQGKSIRLPGVMCDDSSLMC